MTEMTTVALDAMGGDNAPGEIVKGAVQAVADRPDIHVCLVGQEEVVRRELERNGYSGDQIEIVNATEVIETAEPPVNAIRRKKDSSIVVGMKMVKEGKADAFVSAGSSERSLWRTGDRGKTQRCGTSAPCPAVPHGKGSKSSGGLRSQCGRQTLSSCSSLPRWVPSTWNT